MKNFRLIGFIIILSSCKVLEPGYQNHARHEAYKRWHPKEYLRDSLMIVQHGKD